MSRPKYVTQKDIARWSDIIDSDPSIPKEIKAIEDIREVCYCGMWLTEKLLDLNCPESIAIKVQWTAGKLSYGKDPWKVHAKVLRDYKSNKLIIEKDPSESTLVLN